MLAWITVYSLSCSAILKLPKGMTLSCFLCDPGTSGSVAWSLNLSISRNLRSGTSRGCWIAAGSKPALVIHCSPLEHTKAIHRSYSETRSEWLWKTFNLEMRAKLSSLRWSWSGTCLLLCVCKCCKLPTHNILDGVPALSQGTGEFYTLSSKRWPRDHSLN